MLKSVNAKISRYISGSGKGRRRLSREEVMKLRDSTKYKYSTGRNVLGVRILLEDWIHGLEIGHVMQLNPMIATELQNPHNKINTDKGM